MYIYIYIWIYIYIYIYREGEREEKNDPADFPTAVDIALGCPRFSSSACADARVATSSSTSRARSGKKRPGTTNFEELRGRQDLQKIKSKEL